MENENKGVETQASVAPASKEGAVEESHEDNLVKMVESLLKENDRLSKDRDNYREGLLKAKGKATENSDAEPTGSEDIKQIVREEISRQLQNDELAKQKDTVIRELKVALKNRSQVTTSVSGGSSDKVSPSNGVLSPDQVAELKKRNPALWTDEKIKELGVRILQNK